MRRSFPVAVLVLVCGGIAGLAWGEGRPPPACAAANNPLDYGSIIAVPDDVRALIDAYRADWLAFCRQTQPGPVTLANLYAQAGSISEAFDRLIEQAWKDSADADAGQGDGLQPETLDDVLRTTYPRFVPAFEGSFLESTYFNPSTEGFSAYASRGSADDRLFFDSGMPLTSHIWDRPWLERTWDYGGCLLFGRFDWAGEAQKIAGLKKELSSESWLKRVATREETFFSQLEDSGTRICTCERKDAVLEDYRKLVRVVEREPGLASHLVGLRRMIAAIQSSRIRIDSDREQHCSGG
jgi:hypothetical protein